CIIYGLRRTGKTTLIKQLILSMSEEDFSRTVYIKATVQDTMKGLNRDIRKLYECGKRFIFIDEITLISDFIENAAILSDLYCAMGMKIVLSGTDSLGFWLSSYGELYDRAVMVHTTYIPFAEHSRLLGINDIDEYIQYGGTLKAGNWDIENKVLNSEDASFRDDESTRAYIDTAICSNIQHSLKYYKDGMHFRHLYSLYENNELTSAINRLIEHSSHRFLKSILTDEFTSHDFGLAAKNLLHGKDISEQVDLYSKVDIQNVTKKLVEILEIKNKEEQLVEITDVHLKEIYEYLKALDLLDSVENKATGDNLKIEIFTQPGMRFCQAKALVYSMMADNVFDALNIYEKEFITNRVLQTVMGTMLEDIVLLDTKRKAEKNKEVFKLQFAAGEFDMVIFNKDLTECEIFEIKHSNEINKSQYKHLIDEEKLAETKRRFGKITRRCVLYKGESGIIDEGIEYKNVEDFLKGI
ncbi:MAG: AAA family ATPase, partial [Sphaerochaetaceae bacterium]|nr:AAA family ATPase [Sphaerochaetaceae bacterium]